MDAVRLVGLPSWELAAKWPTLLPFIEAALERVADKYRPEHILEAARNADMQVWAVEVDGQTKAVVITEIIIYPTGFKELSVFGVSGNGLSVWQHLISDLHRFGAMHGCQEMKGIGRAGWGRAVGWRERARVFAETVHVGQ